MIKPIYNISFSKQTFTGNRNKKIEAPNEYSSNSNIMKSVPIAALIAMSPMVNIQDANAFEISSGIEYNNNYKKGNVIETVEYPEATPYSDIPAEVSFIDTGDKDLSVSVKFTTNGTYYNDKGIGDQVAIDQIDHLDTLKIRKIIKRYSETKSSSSYKYYISGQGHSIRSAVFDEKGNVISKGWGYPKKEIEITEDFYNFLKDAVDGSIPTKVERVYLDGRTGKRIK